MNVFLLLSLILLSSPISLSLRGLWVGGWGGFGAGPLALDPPPPGSTFGVNVTLTVNVCGSVTLTCAAARLEVEWTILVFYTGDSSFVHNAKYQTSLCVF